MKPFCCAIAALSLASCAQVGKFKDATVSGVSKMGSGVAKLGTASKDSLAKLMPGPRIPVVEVRQQDLRDIKTGRDQAVAFEKTKRNSFWGFFSGPVDFKEPELPVESAAMDGDLLPPKLE